MMTDGGYAGPEKRRYVRVDAKVIAWYKTDALGNGAETYGALTKNISCGGLLFETDEAVPVGAEVEVEMKVPGSPRMLRSKGRTVRLEAVGGGRYDVGLAFESIPEGDRQALEAYIKGLT